MTKKELRQKLLKYYQKNIDKKINNRIMPYKFIDLYSLGLKDNNFFALAMNELSQKEWYTGALQACYQFEDDFKEVYNLWNKKHLKT